MKKIVLLVSFVLCMTSSLFAFATLTAGGGDTITFTTNVPGVTVYKNGAPIATIPGTSQSLKFKREKNDVTLIFRKTGYHDQAVVLARETASAFWINFLVGGIWGLFSDLGTTGGFSSSTDSIFTGNSLEYSPRQYYVELIKA